MKTRLQTCIDSIQCAYFCDLKSRSSPPWCFSVHCHCCPCGHEVSQLAWSAVSNLGLTWPPAQHLCVLRSLWCVHVPSHGVRLCLDCRGKESCHWKKRALAVGMGMRALIKILLSERGERGRRDTQRKADASL